MYKNFFFSFLIILSIGLFSSCNKINLLTIDDEINLGKQTRDQVYSQYGAKILARNTTNAAKYAYIDNMTKQILNSGKVEYKDRFPWEVTLIDDPTLNAFCTPGGYIFVYTGLIKYLDNGSSLAGVMGHEIAHADKRHSGKQLTSQMGIELLLGIIGGTVGGGAAQIAGILTNMGSLKYGRDAETESDNMSVEYLCPTTYQHNGAANFFQKMIDNNQTPGVPEFLSTHPNPDNRVSNINAKAQAATGCNVTKVPAGVDQEYINFKNSF
ncbi:MAG: M48 family metalloprotease [Chitinophagales bacterium]|jgi:predicted Zn-dependent protease|nr:M48 family metalloprotease [Chitinophagales bacterium]